MKISIENISKETLLEAHWQLSRWNWHHTIGRKPLGFDEMTQKDKKEHLKPIMEELNRILKKRDILKYNIVNKNKKSNWYFWKYYFKNFRMIHIVGGKKCN